MKESAKKKLLKKDMRGLKTNPLETRVAVKQTSIDSETTYFTYKPKYCYKHKWDPGYADKIYEIISNGGSMADVAAEFEISPRLAWNWASKDQYRYHEAMAIRATLRVETMFVLADDLIKGKIDANAFKALSNMVMWAASKEGPTMYQDMPKGHSPAAIKSNYVSFLQSETGEGQATKDVSIITSEDL